MSELLFIVTGADDEILEKLAEEIRNEFSGVDVETESNLIRINLDDDEPSCFVASHLLSALALENVDGVIYERN